MKTQYKPILVSVLLVLLSFVCTAQNSESLPAPQPMTGPIPPGTPIDGGVYVVAGLALAYGAYKKRKALK
ncbi:hypothetical protein IA57_05605 [Mangrovimonas yunxiaonensis]|uniref:LPXTG cell wall anchor domain-containing protein n=1 Tax=Mangrovimonas yunxiaonensis TaxID=1197477 RepID=A0A084TKR9_9FLAO|nr:hypothetical protein [Mangrovimonas yunxiaonensis]KFB01305.1 hypothetical protein IA57_05605 [Mangrovimonas yunxiaonensis]GGH37477.1 hypothetical protein GCM10011364_05500 [Mangrovimonas yunxiaonensis]